jgi:hypothetical protein
MLQRSLTGLESGKQTPNDSFLSNELELGWYKWRVGVGFGVGTGHSRCKSPQLGESMALSKERCIGLVEWLKR